MPNATANPSGPNSGSITRLRSTHYCTLNASWQGTEGDSMLHIYILMPTTTNRRISLVSGVLCQSDYRVSITIDRKMPA